MGVLGYFATWGYLNQFLIKIIHKDLTLFKVFIKFRFNTLRSKYVFKGQNALIPPYCILPTHAFTTLNKH